MGAALAELRREAGRQFDPGLVSCFNSLIMSETKDLGLDLDLSGSGRVDPDRRERRIPTRARFERTAETLDLLRDLRRVATLRPLC